MVWSKVEHGVTTPHISYAVTGFALVLFGTVSLFLKEKLYIGEATVATIYGLIVGPHCLKWFSPVNWGNTDYITLEISRIVLTVQIFAVAVELPKKYMWRHWISVTILLLPVMAFGWLVCSAFIWKLIPSLRWIHALCIAGCVTATDPVLAAAVVGKGKFARRVPGHLRNLLSAESGCNDGMAYPFVILAIDIIKDEHHPKDIAKKFICVNILYECVLGCLIGAVIGYGSRHLIKFAEKKCIIDRESFLAYYFCVALFCAGVGTLCGVDDLLVAFAAGCAFSWDGWFAKQTEESHVSNVIDTLLNTAFFVYFGAVVPWPYFNEAALGIKAWKLVCLALIVLVVRRLPILLAVKPFTPDIHTWRESLFCGHFGPIGVGAIFMALLAKAQLQTGTETPAKYPPSIDDPNYYLITTIWPITCFLVITSIIVHGSSVAVFTLGQRINNMAITLTYTTGGNEPSWLQRLPRRSSDGGNILQLQRMETEEPISRKFGKKRKRPSKKPDSSKPEESENYQTQGAYIPNHSGFHDENYTHHKDDDGDDASSILELRLTIDLDGEGEIQRTSEVAAKKLEGKELAEINTYREGDHIVVEDSEGNVVHKFDIGDSSDKIVGQPRLEIVAPDPAKNNSIETGREGTVDSSRKFDSFESTENDTSSSEKRQNGQTSGRARERNIPRMHRTRSRIDLVEPNQQAFAYVIDDTVVVENSEGEILRRYKYVSRGGAPVHAPKKKSWRAYFPGFRKLHRNDTSQREHFEDVENAPTAMLVPDEDGPPLSAAASQAISNEQEDKFRRRLSKMLSKGEINRRPSQLESSLDIRNAGNNQTVRSQAVVSDGEEDGYTTDYDIEDDDDAEPETAVERHRRLAALGVIDNSNENNEYDDATRPDDDEPKITFKLPERRR